MTPADIRVEAPTGAEILRAILAAAALEGDDPVDVIQGLAGARSRAYAVLALAHRFPTASRPDLSRRCGNPSAGPGARTALRNNAWTWFSIARLNEVRAACGWSPMTRAEAEDAPLVYCGRPWTDFLPDAAPAPEPLDLPPLPRAVAPQTPAAASPPRPAAGPTPASAQSTPAPVPSTPVAPAAPRSETLNSRATAAPPPPKPALPRFTAQIDPAPDAARGYEVTRAARAQTEVSASMLVRVEKPAATPREPARAAPVAILSALEEKLSVRPRFAKPDPGEIEDNDLPSAPPVRVAPSPAAYALADAARAMRRRPGVRVTDPACIVAMPGDGPTRGRL